MILATTKWNFDEALYLCCLLEILDECGLEPDEKVLTLYWYLQRQRIPSFVYKVYSRSKLIGVTLDCCGDFWDCSSNDFINRLNLFNNYSNVTIKKIFNSIGQPSLSMKSFLDWEKVVFENLNLINIDSSYAVWVKTSLLDNEVFVKKESILKASEVEHSQMRESFFNYLGDLSINEKYKKYFLDFFMNQIVPPSQAERVFFYRNASDQIRGIGLKQNVKSTQQKFIGLICMERVLRTLNPFEYREVLSLDSSYTSNTLILNDLALNGWAQYMGEDKNKLFKESWLKIKEMEIKNTLNPIKIECKVSNRF